MLCPSCQHEHDADARFCEACGAQLARRCPSCGGVVGAQARFCSRCGASITTPSQRRPESDDQPAVPAPPDAAEGERRQLTVLFCDLVGSTEIAAQVDPEEWREVVRAYQHSADAVIGRFGGHVAQYLGDGLLVYFGWPQAHDDDAERAVRAALGVVEAARNLPLTPSLARRGDADPSPLPRGTTGGLQIRIGIHTGQVVVGRMGAGERAETLALGDTPNIAARVQAMAEPDTVVITNATHRRRLPAHSGCLVAVGKWSSAIYKPTSSARTARRRQAATGQETRRN